MSNHNLKKAYASLYALRQEELDDAFFGLGIFLVAVAIVTVACVFDAMSGGDKWEVHQQIILSLVIGFLLPPAAMIISRFIRLGKTSSFDGLKDRAIGLTEVTSRDMARFMKMHPAVTPAFALTLARNEAKFNRRLAFSFITVISVIAFMLYAETVGAEFHPYAAPVVVGVLFMHLSVAFINFPSFGALAVIYDMARGVDTEQDGYRPLLTERMVLSAPLDEAVVAQMVDAAAMPEDHQQTLA